MIKFKFSTSLGSPTATHPEYYGDERAKNRPVAGIKIGTTTTAGGAKFTEGISGDGNPFNFDLARLIINGRNAVHDSVEAGAISTSFSDTVVETGIKIQPNCNAELLGLSPEQAENWNRDTATRFDLYCSSKTSHRSRMYNVYASQAILQKSFFTDNDHYIRFYFEKEDDALSTVSFEFIDPLSIGYGGFVTTDAWSTTNDGIIRDHRGRETAFQITRIKPDGKWESVTVPHKAGDRILMVHGFIADHVSQTKGIPKIASMLQDLQLLQDFKLSHIQKAIAQAGVSIAIESTGDTDPVNPWEQVVDPLQPAGRRGVTTPTTNETPPPSSDVTIDKVNNFNSLGAGSLNVVGLGAKNKVHAIGNTAPVTNYDEFVESFIKSLSASSGAPIEVVLKKFGSNYSASQGALLLFYRLAMIYRTVIDTDYMTPLYTNWLSEEIASGRKQCPGWNDPVIRAAWIAHTLISAPVPNIDRLKTAKAIKEEVGIGLQDLDTASMQLNGSSGSQNRASLTQQYATLPRAPWDNKWQVETIDDDTDPDDDDD